MQIYFNSLAPCGANQWRNEPTRNSAKFQLTRPVWGEPTGALVDTVADYISTHSPRVGRTEKRKKMGTDLINFNSLAPCGANLVEKYYNILIKQFQLTRPVWGEPPSLACADRINEFQLTRPVWGEPIDNCTSRCRICISTHSPRVGRTHMGLDSR